MKDYLAMVLICSICSFFSSALFGQEKRVEKEMVKQVTTADNKNQNVTVNVNENDGVRENEVVVTNADGSETVWKWTGGSLPEKIRKEMEAAGIEMQHVVSENEMHVTVTRDQDVVKTSNSNRNIQVWKEGDETHVLIEEDGSEQSYKWKGDMPKSIAESLRAVEPALLEELGGSAPNQTHVSLGVRINRTVEVIDENGEKTRHELNIIEGVHPDGSAANAGLIKGDELLSIDGNVITGGGSIRKALKGKKVGDMVKLRYKRNGVENVVDVKLKAKE